VRADTPDPLACRNNIVELDGAKQQLQIDRKLIEGDTVEPNMLTQYFRAGLPVCPLGGSYTIGPIGQEPFCSIAGHSRVAVQQFAAHGVTFPWFVVISFFLLGAAVFGAYFMVRRLTRPLQRTPR
jgi:hypothetical protein